MKYKVGDVVLTKAMMLHKLKCIDGANLRLSRRDCIAGALYPDIVVSEDQFYEPEQGDMLASAFTDIEKLMWGINDNL